MGAKGRKEERMGATGPFEAMLGQYRQEIGQQNRDVINLWAALRWCWPREFGQWLSAHPTPEFIRNELAAAGYLSPSPPLFPRRSAKPNRITGADDHAVLCVTMRWRSPVIRRVTERGRLDTGPHRSPSSARNALRIRERETAAHSGFVRACKRASSYGPLAVVPSRQGA